MRRRARFRTIRYAAIAACLVLALSGGIAYATPASHVVLTQGDITIDLGVNLFGIAVSATSDTEAGEELIESADLLHSSCEKAIDRAVGAMEPLDSGHPVDIVVDARSDKQAKRLERAGEQARAAHGGTAAEPTGDAVQDAPDAGARPDGGQPVDDRQSGDANGDLDKDRGERDGRDGSEMGPAHDEPAAPR